MATELVEEAESPVSAPALGAPLPSTERGALGIAAPLVAFET
jgi:hypothetical protein